MELSVDLRAAAPPARAPLAFYYDFADPESYLALEHLAKALGALAPELIPLQQRALTAVHASAGSAAKADPRPTGVETHPAATNHRQQIEQLASERQLLPMAWPAAWPELDTADAVRAATYAKSIGKVAVYSLSLLRQIFAGGADPAERITLYLAGAASEIHPRAIDQCFARERTQRDVDAALEDARAAGVTTLPALRIDRELITGPALLEDPAELLPG